MTVSGELRQPVRMRYAAEAIAEQPPIVIARDAEHAGVSEHVAARIDVAGTVGEISGAADRVNAFGQQLFECSIEPAMLRMHVTDYAKSPHPRRRQNGVSGNAIFTGAPASVVCR